MVHIFQKIINKLIQIFCAIFILYLLLVLVGDVLSPTGTSGKFSENNEMLLNFVIFFSLQILLYIFYKIKQKKIVLIFLTLMAVNMVCIYFRLAGFIYVHILIILVLLNFYNLLIFIKKVFSK